MFYIAGETILTTGVNKITFATFPSIGSL